MIAPQTPARAVLNWRDGAHWSFPAAGCVRCGGRTNLRDEQGRPSHKTCAERIGVADNRADAPMGSTA